jgi:hypothetical protein
VTRSIRMTDRPSEFTWWGFSVARSRPLIVVLELGPLGMVALAGSVIGTFDPAVLAFAGISLSLVVAIARVALKSVRMDQDSVTIRNVLRTHRVPLREVNRFDLRPDSNPPPVYRRGAPTMIPYLSCAGGRQIVVEALVPFAREITTMEQVVRRMNLSLAEVRSRGTSKEPEV